LCVVIASAARAEVPAVVKTVDAQLAAAWMAEGITPAATVDDARFLRRVTLDLTGRLPEPATVVEFLANESPDKRARAIDRLLASDAYAEHWATYWDNLLMGRLTREGFLDRPAFHEWLRDEFAKNTPWDKLVHELLTAEGYNTNKRPLRGGGPDPADFDERYNPAVNWFLRYSRALPDMASATSKLFLGVQIQCAQCHDHKTEKWKQDDFRQFAACFVKTYPTYVEKPQMLTSVVGVFRMELKDRMFMPPVKQYEQAFGSYADYVEPKPKLLDGPEVTTWGSRRKVLADWVTAKENPWFAKAIVNRLWGKLLGSGFVEPIDDVRPGNPPIAGETWQTLADDFTRHDFDLRHLLRAIANTEAYGRACTALALPPGKRDHWAAYPLKQLDVEELFDAVVQATGAEAGINRVSNNNFALIRGSFINQLVNQGATDDMPEVKELEETIPRSLMLINGALICGSTRTTPGFGLSAALKDGTDDATVVERLYLQTLSRRPTDAERKAWLTFIAKPRTVAKTPGPASGRPQGLAALRASKEIADAPADADFAELLQHAKTAADFAAMRKRLKNNADAGLLAKAFRDYAAEAPFDLLASATGGTTPREQALEDMYWALLNCTEFLTNH
jgi:hypothetical protein